MVIMGECWVLECLGLATVFLLLHWLAANFLAQPSVTLISGRRSFPQRAQAHVYGRAAANGW